MSVDFSYRYMVQIGFVNLDKAKEFAENVVLLTGLESHIIDADEGGEIMHVKAAD